MLEKLRQETNNFASVVQTGLINGTIKTEFLLRMPGKDGGQAAVDWIVATVSQKVETR